MEGGAQPGRHRIYLIRHGETVDNVAGLYAGIRDSALTNHGIQQAQRLGQHFTKAGIVFNHIFSSDLSRAVRTAESLLPPVSYSSNVEQSSTSVVQLKELQEQDFGYYEGKPFYARSADSKKSGKDKHREDHKDEAGFRDVESKESMAARADRFLDEHLMPLLKDAGQRGSTIAIVSHGILLSSLWRCILRRQSPNSISFGPGFTTESRPKSLEHLGGWSNTGYLELELSLLSPATEPSDTGATIVPTASPAEAVTLVTDEGQTHSEQNPTAIAVQPAGPVRYNILIKTINGRDHLGGLKRTGGGVGSSKHDESQKRIESFFKRQKT